MFQNDNRVLVRKGARLVTQEEAVRVNGGAETLTVCTFNFRTRTTDGDINECNF